MKEALANYKDVETLITVSIFILLAIAITGVVYIFTNILDKNKKFSFWILIKSLFALGVTFISSSLCIQIVQGVIEAGKVLE